MRYPVSPLAWLIPPLWPLLLLVTVIWAHTFWLTWVIAHIVYAVVLTVTLAKAELFPGLAMIAVLFWILAAAHVAAYIAAKVARRRQTYAAAGIN